MRAGVVSPPPPPSHPQVANTACNNIVIVAIIPFGGNVSRAGNVTLLAGGVLGYADGPASAALFYSPRGVTPDPASGSIYVAEDFSSRIRVISAAGWVSTLCGSTSAITPNNFADGERVASC